LHRHHLLFFERYLSRIRLRSLAALTPAHISAFIVSEGRRRCKQVMCLLCTALRTFLRYAYMKAVVPEDLSSSVPRPKTYRKSSLPRSITWDEVKAMLAVVDRRTPVGLRDHAMLLLIVTYGLRAREVASLQLGDIDWKRDRLHIRERKAKHATTYPLSETVGQAVLAYLQHARPETDQRRLFLCCLPPVRPVTHATVSMRVTKYLRKAGARVPRPGSHTLRHTCVTRLVDAGFSLKEIGDYVAHRSPVSTAVYAKVSMRNLREVALSDGEDML
jgi:site-specific recombinase XerD